MTLQNYLKVFFLPVKKILTGVNGETPAQWIDVKLITYKVVIFVEEFIIILTL